MTRAEAEQLLILEAGPWLTRVDLDGTTQDGSNPALGATFARVLAEMGYPVSSPLGPTDQELSVLTGGMATWFLRRSMLAVLILCSARFSQADIKALDYEEKSSQLADRLAALIRALMSEVAALPLGLTAVGRVGRIAAGVPIPGNPPSRSMRGIPSP